VLLGIVAGGGALVYQQEHSLAGVVRELKDKEKQRDESARLASRLAQTEMRFKEDTDRLKFLEASLPDMAYVPTLLKQIEQLGRSTHNQVRGVRPEAAPVKPVRAAVRRTDPEAQENGDAKQAAPPPKPEPYTRLAIAVALTGSYKDYQSFLLKLTQFPKIVAVDQVQLRPRPDLKTGNGSPMLEVDMHLTAFVLKQGGAAPTVGDGAPPGATLQSPVPSYQKSVRASCFAGSSAADPAPL